MKLGEIGHGGYGWPDVFDLNTRLHKPHDQRVFDRQRIVAVIIAHGDDRGNATAMHLRAKAKTKGRHSG